LKISKLSGVFRYFRLSIMSVLNSLSPEANATAEALISGLAFPGSFPSYSSESFFSSSLSSLVMPWPSSSFL
jgi:hypothetical protein